MDKIKGCLFGGAVGDALGYEIEFDTEQEIFSRFGPNGIQDYEGIGYISDDTQMTLFTAVGLLMEGDKLSNINKAYIDWFNTQYDPTESGVTWLYKVKELHSLRAPGRTCLDALRKGGNGTFDNPINDSKGCGGIMRVAPIGLFKNVDALMLGAQSAALTHGHELGYIPSGMVSLLVQLIIQNPEKSLEELVIQSLNQTKEVFGDKKHFPYFEELILKAIALSHLDKDDLDCIHQLGEGWVAEETLAIAVYCALKYSNDFKKAVTVSVNHKGDSDSTGAVTGNILGAYLGHGAIPKNYIDHLELKEVILKVASCIYEATSV